ncbi:pro-sigmaK processing inhibitor BofA family protein [Paenibacillus aestuarii]|uniref:Pro-sigmaK processing inhibitor BofA family protein n=1 Tax=Paenibacillus aestuarii TaxID=516965 RepID=A0ABW0KCJ3_9BACL|nr:pro-sigmaK processing inhibitor BofA family protein [Paenibacillus aestuarii]
MYLKYVMWGLLVLSSLLLVFTLFRNRRAGRWLSAVGVNVALAAFLLYLLHLLSGYTHIDLPINTTTLGTVTVLGVPGILLLVCLKLTLL